MLSGGTFPLHPPSVQASASGWPLIPAVHGSDNTQECTHWPGRPGEEGPGKWFLLSQCSFQARAHNLCLWSLSGLSVMVLLTHLRGVCFFHNCQSPLPASPHPAFRTPIKLSQSAGLETGRDRKKSEGNRPFRGGGASFEAAVL